MNRQTLHEQIRQGIKPQGMSTVLFDYTLRIEQLNEILEVLIGDKCPKYCRNNKGCCKSGAYKIGATDEMKMYQKIEGKKQAGNSKCQYHLRECTIPNFRPPICATLLCTEIEDELVLRHGSQGYDFVGSMADATDFCTSLVNGDDGKSLFATLDKAISSGRKLVDKIREEAK